MNNLDSDPGAMITQILLIIILTAVNAFFASAEMAIISVNKSKVKKLSEEGNSNAKLLKKLIDEPSNFISTIQIGITLAGFFSSALAATGISKYFSNVLSHLGLPYAQEISMIIVTLILSYFTLVFGELVPKRIALKKADKIALLSVKPIYFISKFTRPFIKLLCFLTSLVLKITGNSDSYIEEKVSEEEIRYLISQSQKDGCIEPIEKDMLYSVFEFNDKKVSEIMTPRNNMFAINIDSNIEDVLDEILSSSFSRIPVYKDTIDNIVGILYVKDLFIEARKVGFENINLEKILQEPNFVLETVKTNELFNILKAKKVHLAILFDEYGGISGLVSMEDLIEEIVGDIEDEYDNEEIMIRKLDNNGYIVKGHLSVSEFNNKFNINIEEGEYDTLNGYLLNKLGRLPEEGIEFKIENIHFVVSKVNNRRVEDIKIRFIKEPSEGLI